MAHLLTINSSTMNIAISQVNSGVENIQNIWRGIKVNDTVKTSIRRLGQAMIIDLEGDVTIFADEEIACAYQSALDGGGDRIFLNFDKVDYMNSAGIVILINLIVAARKRNVNVGVYGLSAHFQKIFDMAGITRHAKIFRDEAEALLSE